MNRRLILIQKQTNEIPKIQYITQIMCHDFVVKIVNIVSRKFYKILFFNWDTHLSYFIIL